MMVKFFPLATLIVLPVLRSTVREVEKVSVAASVPAPPIEIAAEVVPNWLFALTVKVPALIVVVPLYKLAVVKVRLPSPSLVKLGFAAG